MQGSRFRSRLCPPRPQQWGHLTGARRPVQCSRRPLSSPRRSSSTTRPSSSTSSTAGCRATGGTRPPASSPSSSRCTSATRYEGSPSHLSRSVTESTCLQALLLPRRGLQCSSSSRSSDSFSPRWSLQRCCHSGFQGVALSSEEHVLRSKGPGSVCAGSRGRGRARGWKLRRGGQSNGADRNRETCGLNLSLLLELSLEDTWVAQWLSVCLWLRA